jgi:hypothetical protein
MDRIFAVLGPFDLYGATGMDPLLRSRRELVVQISRLVDYPENLELSVAAMHALTDICQSPVFAASNPHSPHKLYSILEAAGELPNVMEAFIRRLEREETEQVSLISERGLEQLATSASDLVTVNTDAGLVASFGLANLIRLQIIDFLISNLSKAGYGLAHYLVGFGPELIRGPAPSKALSPPNDEGTNYTCLHIILELLAYGLGHPSNPIVVLDHPSFGRKCYELIVALLRNRSTASATIDYLRDREDFYFNQFTFFSPKPVDLTDLGYTIFEFHQRAGLFNGAALDLHYAIAEGSWSYARKMLALFVKGPSSKDTGKAELTNVASTLILQHLQSIESVLIDSFFASLSSAVQEAFFDALSSFIRSAVTLVSLILVALDRLTYDKELVKALQQHLLTSIVPYVCKLLNNSMINTSMLESCSSLMVSIAGYFVRCSASADSTSAFSSILAGDELIQMFKSLVQAISRPDSSLFSRSYNYSAIVDTLQILRKNPSDWEIARTFLICDTARLVEVVASDCIVPPTDADGWTTVATIFLRTLMECDANNSVFEQLMKIGFLKTLALSVPSDDRILRSSLDVEFVNNQTANALFLWQARMALLQHVATVPGGATRLVETGLFDVLSGSRLLNQWDFHPHFSKLGGNPFLLSLLKLLAVVCVRPPGIVLAAIKQLIAAHPRIIVGVMAIGENGDGSFDCWDSIYLASFIASELPSDRDTSHIFYAAIIASLIRMCHSLHSLSHTHNPSESQLQALRCILRYLAAYSAREQHYNWIAFDSNAGSHAKTLVPLSSVNQLCEFLGRGTPTVSTEQNALFWEVAELFLLLLATATTRHGSTEQTIREVRQAIAMLNASLENIKTALASKNVADDHKGAMVRCLEYIASKLDTPRSI